MEKSKVQISLPSTPSIIKLSKKKSILKLEGKKKSPYVNYKWEFKKKIIYIYIDTHKKRMDFKNFITILLNREVYFCYKLKVQR